MKVRIVVYTSSGDNYPKNPRDWSWEDVRRLVANRPDQEADFEVFTDGEVDLLEELS